MFRITSALLALAALAVVPQSATAGARGFAYGVAAGEVSVKTAKLWTRADRPGTLTVEVTDGSFSNPDITRRARATRGNDNTVEVDLRGLDGDTRYRYRFMDERGRTSDVGRFRTAPAIGERETIEFAFSGDADATPRPGSNRPFYNRFQVYRRMAREGNHFNVNLGDTIYSDSEIGGTDVARSKSEKWAKYKQNLDLPNLQRLRMVTGLYNHWDDHEVINDFSIPEVGRRIYNAGVRAFEDYNPVGFSRRNGFYRTFRWGRNLQIWLLDERSFRDAKASEGGTCDNPQTGSPDFAPTAPAAQRSTFSVLIPSLAAPVSQACLDRINSPTRDYLGNRQFRAFTRSIENSNATWKIVLNELPIMQLYAQPYDRWEGYEAERKRLLNFLVNRRVRNVVFLTTDIHANIVGEVRLQTLEPGGPRGTGYFEATTGPVATRTFEKQINDTTGNPAAGQAAEDGFLKPPPPNGIGAQCANLDVFSYGQARVTSREFRLVLKDDRGRPIKDADGRTNCRPLVLRAR